MNLGSQDRTGGVVVPHSAADLLDEAWLERLIDVPIAFHIVAIVLAVIRY